MELIARLDEREERIEVERHGDRYVVRVGEAVYRVDAVAVSATDRSFLIEGDQHEVGIRSLGNGRYQVSSNRGASQVEVFDPLTYLAKESHAGKSDGSALRVSAYMPGRVVQMLVAEGDEVEAGQGVLVLEAMKMENEIQSERAGTVSAVFVEPGQAVENGDPLFEVT
jgi:biotin carboxyl carrier protein